MTAITCLPLEIIASILRELEDIRFLLPCLLTCRHFHTAILEHPSLPDEILRRQIGDELIHTAVAAHCLKRVGVAQISTQVHEILETLYANPAKLEENLRDMSLPDLMRIGRRHEIIHDLTTDWGNDAWSFMSREPLILSDLEYLRLCRALYRLEMHCALVPAFGDGAPAVKMAQGPKIELLARHAPWENEQIACAHDFVEARMMDGKGGR